MHDFFSDRVLRTMFAFAIGVVFVVFEFASNEKNNVLIAMGITWCIASLYWTVKEIRSDWKNP